VHSLITHFLKKSIIMTAISILGLCIIALLAVNWIIYTGPPPSCASENDPNQDFPDWDWNKPQKQFRQLPYIAQVILSGPHKRRTVLYRPNWAHSANGVSQPLRIKMRGLVDGSVDPDKDFMENLNNI
jgi:hypothetical protein